MGKLSDVNFRIAPDDEPGKARVVHYNQLKRLQGPGRVPEEGVIPQENLPAGADPPGP